MAPSIHSQKTLIVGGCGNFGYRVVRWLAQELQIPAGQLAVLDLVAPTSDRKFAVVTYYQADITSISAVSKAINDFRPGVIIHTASPPYHIGDLDIFMKANVGGTQNLLDAAVAEPSVKVLVYTSSSSVVHDSFSDLVEADETYPLLFMPEQKQPYHHSKAMAERLALSYNRKREDFVVAAIRPSGIFGPDDRSTAAGLVERAKKGSLRVQIGNGENRADFTFADNIVHAHVLATDKLLGAVEAGPGGVEEDMKVEGEAFTITNDEHPKFWEFARRVGDAAGYPTDPARVIVIPAFLALMVASLVEWWVWAVSLGRRKAKVGRLEIGYSVITRTFDISKAKKRLGYRPLFSLQEGIELSVAGLREGEEKKEI